MNTAITAEVIRHAKLSLRLDECAKGVQARVVELLPQPLFGSQDERVTLRLKELGFLPGAKISVIGFGLLGSDPMAVHVNGTKFALRKAEAAKIKVEPIDVSGPNHLDH